MTARVDAGRLVMVDEDGDQLVVAPRPHGLVRFTVSTSGGRVAQVFPGADDVRALRDYLDSVLSAQS